LSGEEASSRRLKDICGRTSPQRERGRWRKVEAENENAKPIDVLLLAQQSPVIIIIMKSHFP
jgi:hypothetical protein